jgi:hypothetical protein
MRVIALLDGRPGHEKQTRGILGELAALVDLEVTEITIRRKNLPEMVFDLAGLIAGIEPSFMQEEYRGADLLVGTGSQTHVPMLRLKKSLEIPAITCMLPAPYLRAMFDLCFVPLHDGKIAGGNIFTTIGPANCSRPRGEKDHGAGLVLLGGIDRKSHHWQSEEVGEQVRTIARNGGPVHWTVSSSPRTPLDTIAIMEKIASELDNVDFARFEDTPPGWVEEQYARSRVVWVTADSMSMVYEALSAGCQVGLLPVNWKRPGNKFQRSADYLRSQGLIVAYSSWLCDSDRHWRSHEPLNEAQRCAAEIVRRWPPKD